VLERIVAKLRAIPRKGERSDRASILLPFLIISIGLGVLAWRSYVLSARMESGVKTLAMQYAGYTADSTALDEVTRHLAGKLYADKGYIGRALFNKLWQRGLHLITSIRRNMKNYLMPMADKAMLRKRFVIETVLDILKCEMGLEHSRHRSVINAMVHVLSCLVAYAFRPGKPSISLAAQEITAYP